MSEKDKVDTIASATLTTDQLVSILKTLGLTATDEQLAVMTKPKAEKPTHYGSQHFGYIVRANGFETFVSWREASNESEAVSFSLAERHQCWHLKDTSAHTTETRSISHNEYCEWLRSRDV